MAAREQPTPGCAPLPGEPRLHHDGQEELRSTLEDLTELLLHDVRSCQVEPWQGPGKSVTKATAE
jgi:hypothetical protein